MALAGVVVLASMPVPASEPDSVARAKAMVVKGEKCLEQERYADAETHFRQALKAEPSLPSAHLGLGAALVGQRRYAEALEVLGGAERQYVRHYAELRAAGTQAVGMVEGALDEVENLKQHYGVMQHAPSNLGLDPGVIGRWNVDEVGAIPPQVFYLEGIALLRSDETAAGIDRLRLCLALDSDHGLAHYNLAVALFVQGRLTESRAHLDSAVAAGVEPSSAFVADLDRSLAD